MSVKHKQIVGLALTLREARTVLHLLESCDDADAGLFQETKRIAKRLRIADTQARSAL